MSSARTFGLRRWVSQENPRDLAEQVAGDVEDMDADVGDNEALLLVEIGLGPVDVVVGAEGDARPARRSNGARGDDPRELAHRGGVAEVLVDREPDAGRLRRRDDGGSILEGRGEGFLHDRRDPAGDGQFGERAMGLVPCDDVDEVEALRVEHRGGVGIVRHAEGASGARGGFGVAVADSDERRAFSGERGPGVEMVGRVKAASDHTDPRRHGVPSLLSIGMRSRAQQASRERLSLPAAAAYCPGRRRKRGGIMRIGVVADDFTGASDIANTLARSGARTTLHLGLPADLDAGDDAAVVALKSRSIPAAEAVAQSLEAARALRGGRSGADRLQVLLDLRFDAGRQHRPGGRGAPRPPRRRRRARLSGLPGRRAHHLPGPSLRRRPSPQRERHGAPPAQSDDRRRPPPLAGSADRREGRSPAARGAAGGSRGDGACRGRRPRRAPHRRRCDRERRSPGARPPCRRACARHRRLGDRARPSRQLRDRAGCGRAAARHEGDTLVLAGSCSSATRGQIAAYMPDHPALKLGIAEGLDAEAEAERAIAFALENRGAAPLVYASADPVGDRPQSGRVRYRGERPLLRGLPDPHRCPRRRGGLPPDHRRRRRDLGRGRHRPRHRSARHRPRDRHRRAGDADPRHAATRRGTQVGQLRRPRLLQRAAAILAGDAA